MTKVVIAVAVLLLLLAADAAAVTSDVRLGSWSGGGSEVTFFAYSAGPDDPARDVVMFVDIPGALEIDFYGDHARCDATVRPVRCSAPELASAGGPLEAHFRYHAPEVDATYTITARVESSSLDPDLTNNTSSVTITKQATAHLTSRIEPTHVRAEPGSVHVFDVSLRNYASGDPRDIRAHFATTGATIEAIEPASADVTCNVTGATTAECSGLAIDPGCLCSSAMRVTLRANGDRSGATGKLEVSTTSNLPDPFPFPGTATLETYRIIAVTNTADAGPGSLRDAIVQANAQCTPGPCKIAFELPAPVPPEGWFTLVPASELPPITADRVFLDGTTQTRFTGDTNPRGPEIAIDGHLALRGLEINSPCDSVVEGLAIGHFIGGDGLLVRPSRECFDPAPDRKLIAHNYIGINPDATAAWPNQRGLNLDGLHYSTEIRDNVVSRNKWSGIWLWRGSGTITKNLIEDNGKSGIVLGPESSLAYVTENVINRQADMGVAIAPGATLYRIQQNSMMDNGGIGIDIGVDGRSPVDTDDSELRPSNAPVLLSAVYDPARDMTVLTMTLRSRVLGRWMNNFWIDVYSNRGPDGDGERWLAASCCISSIAGEPFTVLVLGNLTGQWLNATSTRTHSSFAKPPDDKRVTSQGFTGDGGSTSELSNTVLVTGQL